MHPVVVWTLADQPAVDEKRPETPGVRVSTLLSRRRTGDRVPYSPLAEKNVTKGVGGLSRTCEQG